MPPRTSITAPMKLLQRNIHSRARNLCSCPSQSSTLFTRQDSYRPAASQSTFRHQRTSHRPLTTTSPALAATTGRNASPRTQRTTPRPQRNIADPSRGPESKEDTQTDFSALNVLGATASPTTSVDVCTHDGFILDSGLRISDGDGVLLLGREAFVWRPWMADPAAPALAGIAPTAPTGSSKMGAVVSGTDVYAHAQRQGRRDMASLTAGVINTRGQFEVPDAAWGLLAAVWPRPDLLVIGTGKSILPLAPATRAFLQRLGFRLEVLDTRNAASQFNLLATERGVEEVAGVMLPIGFGDVI